jgi:hypothetical protein
MLSARAGTFAPECDDFPAHGKALLEQRDGCERKALVICFQQNA